MSTDQLAILTDIERRLAKVERVDEGKSIRDKAEAIRTYAKSARLGLDVQNRAALVKILAEQRTGALLTEVERSKGGGHKRSSTSLGQVLKDNDIPRTTGERWQAMAAVPEARVRALHAELGEGGEELTSARVYAERHGGAHVRHNSGQSEWYTPAPYLEAARFVLGTIDLDPASAPAAQAVVQARAFYTAADDGLAQPWAGTVWLNPPYSQPLISHFLDKLLTHAAAGEVTAAIVLTNNATDTEWAQNLMGWSAGICFPNGRVSFWAPGRADASPLQGQMLCYIGPDTQAFDEAFDSFGAVLRKRLKLR